MILVPPEICENHSQPLTPPVKKKTNDRSYKKWTQIRLHQDLRLKN